MSIPEFLNELDSEQLRVVIKMSKEKIEKITGQERVLVWVFSSGVVNEGFYSTEEDAIQALKDYVNSKKYSVYDTLSVFKTLEYPEEAKRLLDYGVGKD